MRIEPSTLLAREARSVGNDCELLRAWVTNVHGHELTVLVYTHGYKDDDLAAFTSIRYSVYDRARQIGGGIIA